MNAPTAPQAPRATLTLEALNAATPEAAVMLLDGTYEHSPWVAQAARASALASPSALWGGPNHDQGTTAGPRACSQARKLSA